MDEITETMNDLPWVVMTRDIFFAAMNDGYVSGREPVPIPGIPGAMGYTYRQEDKTGAWEAVDCWVSNRPGDQSAGWTIVFHGGKPYWQMSYSGFYSPHALPFLKRVLGKCYAEKRFCGARGPYEFMDHTLGMRYTNALEPNSSFMDFSGREEIWSIEGHDGRRATLLGYHDFRGHFMTAPI